MRLEHALVMIAIAAAAVADAEGQLATTASRQDSALATVVRYSGSFGSTRPSLIKRLGKPSKIDVRAEANRAGYGNDSIFTLRYSGITFFIRQSGYDRKTELLDGAEQTKPPSSSPAALKIGSSTRRDVERVVGTTRDSSRRADTLFLTYPSPLIGADEWVVFAFVGNVLRAIRWVLYTG
jgi:hypothetical protein